LEDHWITHVNFLLLTKQMSVAVCSNS